MSRKLLIALVVMVAALCGGTAAASASTYYWYNPGCFGTNYDCWPTSTNPASPPYGGSNHSENEAASGFFPSGSGGYGGVLEPPNTAATNFGAFCTPYWNYQINNPPNANGLCTLAGHDSAHGSGYEWYIGAGLANGNMCPYGGLTCGNHYRVQLDSGGDWTTSVSKPWATGFGANPSLVLDHWQAISDDTTGSGVWWASPSDWHAGSCAELIDSTTGKYLEDCSETWRADNNPPNPGNVTAFCQQNNTSMIAYQNAGGTGKYWSDLGQPESYGNVQSTWQHFIMTQSKSQITAMLGDVDYAAGACGLNGYSHDPSKYVLIGVNWWIEGGGSYPDSTGHTTAPDPNAHATMAIAPNPAYTTY